MFAVDMKRMGAKIVYYRKLQGVTQSQLAEKVSISPSYMSKIERGASVQGVPFTMYLKIAKELGVTLDDLLKG
ncbi:helix-turn-helix domain-containing protein [Phascolarctobacterium sp.]|uniref:helix-turn-helix domain-containing protein n=2 Tax=Phascolarctobacterium sp. TaxID=2049039 RepID=UPI0038706911